VIPNLASSGDDNELVTGVAAAAAALAGTRGVVGVQVDGNCRPLCFPCIYLSSSVLPTVTDTKSESDENGRGLGSFRSKSKGRGRGSGDESERA